MLRGGRHCTRCAEWRPLGRHRSHAQVQAREAAIPRSVHFEEVNVRVSSRLLRAQSAKVCAHSPEHVHRDVRRECQGSVRCGGGVARARARGAAAQQACSRDACAPAFMRRLVARTIEVLRLVRSRIRPGARGACLAMYVVPHLLRRRQLDGARHAVLHRGLWRRQALHAIRHHVELDEVGADHARNVRPHAVADVAGRGRCGHR